jgi:MFS family permease
VGAFGVLSIACAVAPTIGVLIAARALQGAAGALLTPSSLAVIVSAFPGKERGAAIGSWTAWGGIAAIIGPLAGGWIVDQASWRWIFALNVPIVLGTVVLILRVVPAGRERDPDARVDVIGALLCALGLAGMTFGLIEQPLHGWGSVTVAGAIAAGAVLAWLNRREAYQIQAEQLSEEHVAVVPVVAPGLAGAMVKGTF